MKIKVHHILLIIFVVFISGMFVAQFAKKALVEGQRIKSDITDEELNVKINLDAKTYIKNVAPGIEVEKIVSADFFFFKNKREIEAVLNDGQKKFFFKLSFKNLSPGYGLRDKLTQLTPAEGIYKIDYVGYIKDRGLFVRVLYPPKSYKDYQRLDFEALQKDPYLISEKPISSSFIQTNTDFIKLLIYLTLNLDPDSLRLLIYPDKPPLLMELGGTEFSSEIYKKLDEEFKLLERVKNPLEN